MVKEGTGVAYKSFRTFSNKISTSDLQQNDEFQISTYPSKQPNCFELPLKDGRDKESGTSQTFEGDLALSSQTSGHDYCGVPFFSIREYLPGFLNYQANWESTNAKDSTESAIIPENMFEGGSTRDSSIYFSVVQSAPGLLLMEA